MSLDFWSVAAAPARRPLYDDDPFDSPACPSRLFPENGMELGRRRCSVNHAEVGPLHGELVVGEMTWWTDQAAVASEARYRAAVAALPRCLRCDIRPDVLKGCCPRCAQTESRAA